jgi:hypothetical protein
MFGYSYFDIRIYKERIEIQVDYWNCISMQHQSTGNEQHQNLTACSWTAKEGNKPRGYMIQKRHSQSWWRGKTIIIIFMDIILGCWMDRRSATNSSTIGSKRTHTFCSRKYGLLVLSEDDLSKINYEQGIGKTYIDAKAVVCCQLALLSEASSFWTPRWPWQEGDSSIWWLNLSLPLISVQNSKCELARERESKILLSSWQN